MSEEFGRPTRSRRVRPALRVVAIVAVVLLVPVAAHSAWDYVEIRRLVREIEAIQAKGEPVSETAALGAVPQSGEGAARYYLAAAMLSLDSRPYGVARPMREWLAGPNPDRSTLPQLTVGLQQLVDNSREALALADKAATLPFTRFPGGTEFSYRAAGLGSLYQLVAARSLSLSAASDGDGAVDSLIVGFRLRRALRDVYWNLVMNDDTAAVLSLSNPSPDALRRLADALASEDDAVDDGRRVMLSQRARYLEMTWRRHYGSDPSSPRHYTLPIRSLPDLFMRPWITHDIVDGLRVWAELGEVAKTPWPQKARASSEILDLYRQQSRPAPTYLRGIVSREVALGMFADAVDPRAMIAASCARIAVAIERFRRDRNDQMPPDLAALVPSYLTEVPVDPYSGQSLMVRSGAGSYTIYSVGADQKDDGGDLTSELEAAIAKGFGLRRIRGNDVGVRVLMH